MKNNKKILLVTRPLSPPWDEASKNFAFDLVKNISNKNITILTSTFNKELSKNIQQKQIHSQSKNDFNFAEKIRSLLFQIKNHKNFDIIHFMFTPTKLNSFVIKNFVNNKKTKTIQTVTTLREDLYSDEELKKLMFGDVIVTYSKYAKEKLKSFGLKNVQQIYPGINLSKFKPEEKNLELMKKWNLTEKDFIVSFPGEYVRLDATDFIIDTFIELWKNKKNHNIKYLCACRIKNEKDAKKKKEVIETLKKVGHLNKVVFTDTFGDVNKIYNLSDVVLFPVNNMKGKFDVPLAMIEPYACKKPVIASDLPILQEFSSEKINVIIKRNNKEDLKNAILLLKDDEDKKKELGENAFDFAHETFDIKEIAEQYEKIYEELF
ncbi:MAG: glycosyltransferase family 4 protein [Candidatus Moranbacteria bacterium]|nr:glycosyltransferase family 4 protein [Candidatus Moranbacteria bacterium]